MWVLKAYLLMLSKAIKDFFLGCLDDTKIACEDLWYELKQLIKSPWWFISGTCSILLSWVKSLYYRLSDLSSFYKFKIKKKKAKK